MKVDLYYKNKLYNSFYIYIYIYIYIFKFSFPFVNSVVYNKGAKHPRQCVLSPDISLLSLASNKLFFPIYPDLFREGGNFG